VGQWECSDLFPVRGGNSSPSATHVLKASTNGADHWVVGEALLVWLFQSRL
jgi:hypothetical protein